MEPREAEAEARSRGDAEDAIRSAVGAEATRNQAEEEGGPRCGVRRANTVWALAEGRRRRADARGGAMGEADS
jgi:hypothetical protein